MQEPAAAVIEIAALDSVPPGLVTADAAARRGLLTDAEPLVTAWGRHQGAASARTVIAHADGRHESPLETRVAFEAFRHGIHLLPQVEIKDAHGQFTARGDFVVVEVDGLSKYTDGSLRSERLTSRRHRTGGLDRCAGRSPGATSGPDPRAPASSYRSW